jgi:hypothetical protein
MRAGKPRRGSVLARHPRAFRPSRSKNNTPSSAVPSSEHFGAGRIDSLTTRSSRVAERQETKVENRPADSPRSGTYAAWLMGGAALVAALAYGASHYARTFDPPTIDTNSLTTSRPGPANAQNQPSPQGPTGPLNTTSGGAPAASPQGETPPGMQSAQQGSAEKAVAPAK